MNSKNHKSSSQTHEANINQNTSTDAWCVWVFGDFLFILYLCVWFDQFSIVYLSLETESDMAMTLEGANWKSHECEHYKCRDFVDLSFELKLLVFIVSSGWL
jgi:hypothetical protein